VKYPVVSNKKHIQDFYVLMRQRGESHSIADMLAHQAAPQGVTDNMIFEGQGTILDQCGGDEDYCNYLVNEAKKDGYKPGINDVYMPSLAEKPGAKEAWISPSGGRSQIKKVCEEKNWNCSGAVKHKATPEEPEFIRLGEDLVQQGMKEMIEREPEKANLCEGELREQVIDLHGFAKND